MKRSHCSGNERDNRLEIQKTDTYQRRNILIYYCVIMIPTSIILYLESISFV